MRRSLALALLVSTGCAGPRLSPGAEVRVGAQVRTHQPCRSPGRIAWAPGGIHGCVLDEVGAPLPGITVTLVSVTSGAGPRDAHTTTFADGTYGFDVPAGTYEVRFVGAGFRKAVFRNVRTRPSGTVLHMVLTAAGAA